MVGLNAAQKWMVLLMDVLLLAELTFSVWVSVENGQIASGPFLRWYPALALVTFLVCRRIIRRLDDGPAPGEESAARAESQPAQV